MTKAQKTIKYLALAFALYLVVNIISGIWWGVGMTVSALGLGQHDSNASAHLQEITTDIDAGELTTMKIDLRYANLHIVQGDRFLAESSSPDISCKQNQNQLIITEKRSGLFWRTTCEANTLTIYIPEDMVFDGVIITNDIGTTAIQELNARELYFSLGAGEVQINSLNVSDTATIDGGIGKLKIRGGRIHNLKLELGVGEANIDTIFTGSTVVDAGIGEVKIQLLDSIENYCFQVDKGIGDIRIGGVSVADDTEFGDGENLLDISGGIGEITIREK